MMRALSGIGLALAVLAAPAALRADDKLAESLVGTYTYESGMEGKREIDKNELGGQTVNITKDDITLIDKDGKTAFVIKYTIKPDSTEKKCELEMEIVEATVDQAVGSKAGGLLKKDGETVTLIYNAEGEAIPKDFMPEEGEHLFVLKRKAK